MFVLPSECSPSVYICFGIINKAGENEKVEKLVEEIKNLI